MKRKMILVLIFINIGLHATSMNKLKSNCNAGHAIDCGTVGTKYYSMNKLDKAYYYQKKACSMKNAHACLVVGLYYGVDEDKIQSDKYFTKSCNLNNTLGCVNLGSSHISADKFKKALAPLKKACYSRPKIKGSEEEILVSTKIIQEACSQVGLLYYKDKKINEASKAMKRTCMLGKKTDFVKLNTTSLTFCDVEKVVSGNSNSKFIEKLINHCDNSDEQACSYLFTMAADHKKVNNYLCKIGNGQCIDYSKRRYSSSDESSESSGNSQRKSNSGGYSSGGGSHWETRRVLGGNGRTTQVKVYD